MFLRDLRIAALKEAGKLDGVVVGGFDGRRLGLGRRLGRRVRA